MRPVILVVIVATGVLFVPGSSAWDPDEGPLCRWIQEGPVFFSRACVDPANAPECGLYLESWNWEGGYRKTCVGV